MWCVPHVSLQERIPDDRSSRSQFDIIDDELDRQLRDILEEAPPKVPADSNKEYEDGGSAVFKYARDQYK